MGTKPPGRQREKEDRGLWQSLNKKKCTNVCDVGPLYHLNYDSASVPLSVWSASASPVLGSAQTGRPISRDELWVAVRVWCHAKPILSCPFKGSNNKWKIQDPTSEAEIRNGSPCLSAASYKRHNITMWQRNLKVLIENLSNKPTWLAAYLWCGEKNMKFSMFF